MKQTLTPSAAAEILSSDKSSSFTYAGALALCEHIDDIDENTEFDRVGLRCEFTEYSSLVDCAENVIGDYKEELSIDEDADEDEIDDAIREYLQERTSVIEFDDGVVIQDF
jgi:hypothetical protein